VIRIPLSNKEKAFLRSKFIVPPKDLLMKGPKGEKYPSLDAKRAAAMRDMRRKGIIPEEEP
jgi:hypothetical protein